MSLFCWQQMLSEVNAERKIHGSWGTGIKKAGTEGWKWKKETDYILYLVLFTFYSDFQILSVVPHTF